MYKFSIVLVPFPFDDFKSSKVRSALCLTSEIGIYNHIIIAFISSRIPEIIGDYDVVLKKETPNWEGSGLIVDSIIRLHKVVTIPKNVIQKKLGKLNASVQKDVMAKISTLYQSA